MAKLTAQGATLHLVFQNFYELWVTLTPPVTVAVLTPPGVLATP